MAKVLVSGTCIFTHEAKVSGLRPHNKLDQHFSEILEVVDIPAKTDDLDHIKAQIKDLLEAPSWTTKTEVMIDSMSVL